MKWPKLALATILILCSSYGFAVDVSTAADLAEALTTSPAGTTVTLGADIDCTGWATVDSFSGTLDGQGYKITNLDAPLFGTITGDIAISNLVANDVFTNTSYQKWLLHVEQHHLEFWIDIFFLHNSKLH